MADAQYFELCSLVFVRLVFALHGSVMNTMPPSCIREVRTEVLIDMMADLSLSCLWNDPVIIMDTLAWYGSVPHKKITIISAERSARGLDSQWSHFSRSLLCFYCMASWRTRYHNDSWGLRSRSRCSHDGFFSVFLFLRRGSIMYKYNTCTVSSGDDHHTTMIFLSYSLDGFDGWYLEVFFVRSGSCRCYVCFVWYRGERTLY